MRRVLSILLIITCFVSSKVYGNDTDEFLTKGYYVYDSIKGSKIALKKKEQLNELLYLYDKKLSLVYQWMKKGNVKIPKPNNNSLSEKALGEAFEYETFVKLRYLSFYEKDHSKAVGYESIINRCISKRKVDKSLLPVLRSYAERLRKERFSIEQIIQENDSVIIKFGASELKYLGLVNDVYSTEVPLVWVEKKYKNPNYDPVKGEWAWLQSREYENVSTTYPLKEKYRKYVSKPDYKVKEIKGRLCVFSKDNKCLYVEKPKNDDIHELKRQVCIYDYLNNKYDVESNKESVLRKINEMLVLGYSREYYLAQVLTCNGLIGAFNAVNQLSDLSSFDGMMLSSIGIGVPEASEKDYLKLEEIKEELRKSKAKLQEIDSDPEYNLANNYIKQLKSDREKMTFNCKRVDGFTLIYTSNDGEFDIIMKMYSDGESISEEYNLNKNTTVKDVGIGCDEELDDDLVFTKVEKQASFPGGKGAMMKWLSNHINYPSICAESGIEGKVFVQFTVKKDGSITDVQVVRGAHELLNVEAVRVVASMPKWNPGEQQGQKVSSKFTLPVVFSLQ